MEEIYSYWRCVRKAGIVRQVQSDSFDKGKIKDDVLTHVVSETVVEMSRQQR